MRTRCACGCGRPLDPPRTGHNFATVGCVIRALANNATDSPLGNVDDASVDQAVQQIDSLLRRNRPGRN